MAHPDLVAKRVKTFPVDYSSYREHSSEESAESQSTPRMTQEKKTSSKSSTSTYPHSTRNIEDDVKKDIEKTRELNTQKEELWAKFSENTEVNVVTRLDSLSSSEIGELSKWLREKKHPQINSLSISNSDIDDKAAKALAKAIKPKTTFDKLTTLKSGHKLSKLATLELVGNTISDEGIITLANAISTNRTITNLIICVRNKIGGEAVNAIARMVGTNETFKELEFKGFKLNNDESKPIYDAYKANPKSKIESLTFNSNQ